MPAEIIVNEHQIPGHVMPDSARVVGWTQTWATKNAFRARVLVQLPERLFGNDRRVFLDPGRQRLSRRGQLGRQELLLVVGPVKLQADRELAKMAAARGPAAALL